MPFDELGMLAGLMQCNATVDAVPKTERQPGHAPCRQEKSSFLAMLESNIHGSHTVCLMRSRHLLWVSW